MRQTGKIIINKVEKPKTKVKNVKTNLVNSKSPSYCQIFEFILVSINRLLIGFVTIYMGWMCLRLKYEDIPFHAVLCTLGFVCLMSEGLLSHYRGNAWTLLCFRTEKSRTHWILQLTGSIIGLVGIGIKCYIEEVHFHTVHGLVGLATAVLLILSLLTGLSALYATEMKHYMQPLCNKAFHNIWGLLTFTLAMISMYTAYETEIFFQHSLDAANYQDFKWLIQSCIVIIWLLTCYGPLWCLIYSKLCRTC
ncbi:uncharacterized protein LOC119611180 [Lucilia sericata]|uniref:uncharacterized protein LOC119611180 n=1 Tax=Lucilia sericata TaxID=13632 RepID=UPI0018A8662D|nr:uncharacterized protein LOC119611180 [Lucilia sericata]